MCMYNKNNSDIREKLITNPEWKTVPNVQRNSSIMALYNITNVNNLPKMAVRKLQQ